MTKFKATLNRVIDMNLYERYKKIKSSKNCLSKVDVAGSFDFYTFIVSFDSLGLKDIESLKSIDLDNKYITHDDYVLISKILPLAAHEYTHFYDTTSTIWGMNHLKLMSNAYSSEYERFGGNETDFYKAKIFNDHIKSLSLPDYYTVINKENKSDGDKPWRYQVTAGKRFSSKGEITDHPIIFCRFKDRLNIDLVRSPISTVSILEASAMAQEIVSQISLIRMLPEDQKIIEGSVFSKKITNYIYNKELTEYSVCTHLIANHQNCKDIFSAYSLCFLMTRVILNFPPIAYKKIIDDCDLSKVLGYPEKSSFLEVLMDGVRYHDMGTIFYLLCQLMPAGSHNDIASAKSGIKDALYKLTINMDWLIIESKKEMDELERELCKTKIKYLKTIGKAGYNNYLEAGFLNALLPFDYGSFLPALLNDGNYINIFTNNKNQLEDIDLDLIFNDLFLGQKWVERFSEACL